MPKAIRDIAGNAAVRMFFFASSRRHTRFSRDWSSDVCSSDLDHNANGTQDGVDQGLGGWTIRAYDGAGNVADFTSTANDGTYTLTLQPGAYTICEVLQNNWTQSHPTGTDCKALNKTGLGDAGYSVTVSSSGAITGKDFGNYTTGTVSGLKFEDHNANRSEEHTSELQSREKIICRHRPGNKADFTS